MAFIRKRKHRSVEWRTDFSLGAFLEGWRNVHRRAYGLTPITAGLVAILFVLAVGLVLALLIQVAELI